MEIRHRKDDFENELDAKFEPKNAVDVRSKYKQIRGLNGGEKISLHLAPEKAFEDPTTVPALLTSSVRAPQPKQPRAAQTERNVSIMYPIKKSVF